MNLTASFARRSSDAGERRGGLEVRSIAKSYDRRAVLHDVSLDVHRGEVVGLLGPNGAGKTTCFYSVMGLVKPDSDIAGESRSPSIPNSPSSRSRIADRVFGSGSETSRTARIFSSTVSPRKIEVSCGR